MTQRIVRTNFDREESRRDRCQSMPPIFLRIAERDGDYDFDAEIAWTAAADGKAGAQFTTLAAGALDRALAHRLNRSRR